jgi:hypothetical protein
VVQVELNNIYVNIGASNRGEKSRTKKKNTATCHSYIPRFAGLIFMFLSFHDAGG